MIRNIAFIIVVNVLVAACQERREVSSVTLYNSELANALQDRQILNKKRAALTFESGTTAQNCGEYLRLSASSMLKEEVNNQLAKSEYLACDVAAILGDTKYTLVRKDAPFGQTLANRLDLRTFPSSLFQMLDEKKYSLSAVGARAVKVESTSATYETGDVHYRLELVATLDMNRNGKLDWVLWLADEAKSGNYRQYQTLIVQDARDTGSLRAVPYPYAMNTQKK